MKFIIKLHPEIMIKSRSVRKRFTQILQANIRQVFKRNQLSVEVLNQYDKLVLKLPEKTLPYADQVRQLLSQVPGIDQCVRVLESHYHSIDDIFQQVKAVWQHKLVDKTFAVRVKRKGQQDFSSTDVAAYVGGGLNQSCETGGVKLKHPDVTVNLEIEREKLYIVEDHFRGLGGMPIPTQQDVLSLISGGFDSGVASYQMIRRGAKTHYVFFNLGGRDHEIGMRSVVDHLWRTFSSSHKVKFIAVDFAPVVHEILEKVDSGQMGVVLKRMMLRAASQVADGLAIDALVTGECLGQVSSQTLTNLHVIDQVTEKLILRPLICSDKNDIIQIARKIGTEDFAKSMPEYCGVISQRPTVAAKLGKIRAEEAKMDMSVLDRVVSEANVEDIRAVTKELQSQLVAIESTRELMPNDVVLDIRSSEEVEANPLHLVNVEVIHLPFFRLSNQFSDLPQDKSYFLYCERGVMSKMQAALLKEQGFNNAKVYQP